MLIGIDAGTGFMNQESAIQKTYAPNSVWNEKIVSE